MPSGRKSTTSEPRGPRKCFQRSFGKRPGQASCQESKKVGDLATPEGEEGGGEEAAAKEEEDYDKEEEEEEEEE